MKVNGTNRNFLFDTGAQLTILQQDSLTGKSSTMTGANDRKVKMGREAVALLQLGEVNFTNTHAVNAPLQGLKDSVANFGGLIGQPIINKANWLIDYRNKTVQLANYNLADAGFQSLKIQRKEGSPYTQLTISGKQYRTLLDMGSSGELTVPAGSKLATELLAIYDFEEQVKDSYTLGGWQKVKQQVATISSVKLGEVEFSHVEVKIKPTNKMKVGILLFKNHLLYIDNTAGNYKIKPLSKSSL